MPYHAGQMSKVIFEYNFWMKSRWQLKFFLVAFIYNVQMPLKFQGNEIIISLEISKYLKNYPIPRGFLDRVNPLNFYY